MGEEKGSEKIKPSKIKIYRNFRGFFVKTKRFGRIAPQNPEKLLSQNKGETNPKKPGKNSLVPICRVGYFEKIKPKRKGLSGDFSLQNNEFGVFDRFKNKENAPTQSVGNFNKLLGL